MKSLYPIKSVGDVLTLEYGKPLPETERTPQGGVPAYGANGVLCWSKKAFRREPSIIVGRKGSAGEINLTQGPFWPTDVTYFVEHDERVSDLRYLFYALKLLNLPKLAKGVKPGINRNDVYALTVPLPPILEQRRIVAILDGAFEGIYTAAANAEKNIANARELFNSYLNSVFARKGEGWDKKCVADLCEAIVDCVNRTAPKSEVPTEYKMIRTTNVRNGRISLENVNCVSKEVFENWTGRQIPQKNDVILTREAPMGEVGMIETKDKVFLGQRIVSYRANSAKILSRFLFYALRSNYLQQQIHNLASGSTVQHMRVPDSKNLIIPIPSIRLQKTFVEKLDYILLQCDVLHSSYQEKLYYQ